MKRKNRPSRQQQRHADAIERQEHPDLEARARRAKEHAGRGRKREAVAA